MSGAWRGESWVPAVWQRLWLRMLVLVLVLVPPAGVLAARG